MSCLGIESLSGLFFSIFNVIPCCTSIFLCVPNRIVRKHECSTIAVPLTINKENFNINKKSSLDFRILQKIVNKLND